MTDQDEHLTIGPETTVALERAWGLRVSTFPDKLICYTPRKTLTLSLTGTSCSLNCAHCGGHYLKSMTPIERCHDAVERGSYSSCLLSGGCSSEGSVDIKDKLEIFRYIKGRGMRINSHVGLIEREEMEEIAPFVDRISFDFVVHDDTISEVFGTNRRGSDYIRTYRDLRDMGLPVVPHICAGLRGGAIDGEYDALEILAEIGADGLVFIVLIPTAGTRYAHRLPPQMDLLAKLFIRARELFRDIPINLGCMRPRGRYRAELDVMAVKCGFNGIVNPTTRARELARSRGLTLVNKEECCAL